MDRSVLFIQILLIHFFLCDEIAKNPDGWALVVNCDHVKAYCLRLTGNVVLI